jgi:TonB family protein
MFSPLFAIAASIAPGAPTLQEPRPVSGSLTGIFATDDYPPDALDLNEEGSVGVLVRVDTKGAVSDCTVTSSSGSPALDAQTCRIVWLRAKFIPAQDATGKPVASTYQQRINWAIGDDEEGETSDPYMVRWIVSGWQNGYPSCRTELGGAAETGTAGATQCPPYIAGVPASLSATDKADPDIVIEQRFSVGASPNVALAPADRFIGRELARIDIDAAGRVASCKLIETTGIVPRQIPRTCLITAKHYARKKDAQGRPVAFTAYYMISLYGHFSK